jgi:hypothetical protein
MAGAVLLTESRGKPKSPLSLRIATYATGMTD